MVSLGHKHQHPLTYIGLLYHRIVGLNLAAVCGTLSGQPQLGNIYTSSNRGSTWTQRTSGLPTSANWVSIASDSSGQKLVAVVNGGGIWISTNSGSTWTQTAAPATSPWTCITSNSNGTILAATVPTLVPTAGIYMSFNSGLTWTQQLGTTAQEWTSIKSNSSGTIMYATARDSGGGIYNYTSTSGSWVKLTNQPFSYTSAYYQSITCDSSGTKVAVAISKYSSIPGGIYTSQNSGTSWSTTITFNFQYITVSSSGQYLATTVSNSSNFSTVYISTDFGSNWVQIASSQFTISTYQPNLTAITSSSTGQYLAVCGTYTDSRKSVV